jgi:hypothetical protein
MKKLPSKLIYSRVDGVTTEASECLIYVTDGFLSDRAAALDLFKSSRTKGILAQVVLHAQHYAPFGLFDGIEEGFTQEDWVTYDQHGSVVITDPARIRAIVEAVEQEAVDYPLARMDYVRLVVEEHGLHVVGLEKHSSDDLQSRFVSNELFDGTLAVPQMA